MKARTISHGVFETTRNLLAILLTAALFALVPLSAGAGTAAPLAADPVLEERLMTLAGELRCLVCQNQTLAESNAELAADLRNEIREQMRRGASDKDVVDYLVARYGDFVLYRPPLKGSTLLLWSGPGLLLLAGIVFLARTLLRRRQRGVPLPLSAQAQARARELLGTGSVEDPT
jgi:cytochrome c-type biogenesis protein CcmH